ncbi:MAG TPA: hypothetical protein ENN81_08450, partial [Phycisphaerales bacterium]|nr:hypothetical protein [Phycisphaerales bacterium]
MPARKVAPHTPVAPSLRPTMRPTTPNPIADMPRDTTHNTTPPSPETPDPKPADTTASAAPALVAAVAQTRRQAAVPTKAVAAAPRTGIITGMKTRLFKPRPGVSNTRQKTMVLLIPVLAIALIFVLIKVLGTTPRKSHAKDKAPVAASAATGINVWWELPEPYPIGLRDPMTLASQPIPVSPVEAGSGELSDPTTVPAAGIPQFDLKGVLIGENPCAIIGTRILREADTFDGAVVVKIADGAVTFEKDGQTWTQ